VSNNSIDTAKQSPFAALDLPHELTDNLVSLGYANLTPIQAQSLPLILAGDDVIGQDRCIWFGITLKT
jgi:ATP-independent RNA helicase DbpA